MYIVVYFIILHSHHEKFQDIYGCTSLFEFDSIPFSFFSFDIFESAFRLLQISIANSTWQVHSANYEAMNQNYMLPYKTRTTESAYSNSH